MKKILLLLLWVFHISCLSPNQAAETKAADPRLEFRLVVEKPSPETETLPLQDNARGTEKQKTLITKRAADFGGADFKAVTTVTSKNNTVDSAGKEVVRESTSIAVTLSESAGKRMEVWSKGHLGEKVAIVFDNQVLMAPTIQSTFGTHFMISGNFSTSEAKAIVRKLTAKKPKPGPAK